MADLTSTPLELAGKAAAALTRHQRRQLSTTTTIHHDLFTPLLDLDGHDDDNAPKPDQLFLHTELDIA